MAKEITSERVHLEIQRNVKKLTRQQVKTLYGQIKVGNHLAAYKGLLKLIQKENGVNGDLRKQYKKRDRASNKAV